MKSNPVKKALQAGQPQIGTWLSLESVFATRFMARVGFPWLTVDIEHSPVNWETAAHMFAAIAEAGCVPLARVPRGDHDLIKRVLDAGAMGIVVPMVNTVEEAKAAIAAAKYPPVGNRSVGGAIHSLNFDAAAGDYYKYANDEILVVLQTESPEGVDNAPEIYALPGVDAIFVGPNDLKFQMRNYTENGDDPTPEEFEAMLQRILQAGKTAGTPVGLHVVTVEDAKRRADEGWQFIAMASELKMMVNEATRVVKALDLKAAGDLARY
ncbi:MAG: HpcH/HpaI aldolase family protein [Rubinisphaera brasiliensis]|uniref:HpcH/HpaI aldolase family protein n=1 Tax=Rubinisphaera brasiliensis TaxID=119 RepID=UPI00391D76E9